jgi:hypothetical protein
MCPYFLEICRCFLDALHELGFRNLQGNRISSKDITLLHLIRNSVFTRNVLFPQIWSNFLERIPENFRDDLDVESMDLNSIHVQFEFSILQEYIRRKSIHISKIMRQGIVLCPNPIMQDWKAEIQNVKEIRTYVEESLLELVTVHQELSVCGVQLERVNRILNSLTDQVFITFLRCAQEIENISPAYSLQLLIEVEFISTILNKRMGESCKNLYVKALTYLEEICEEDVQDIRDSIVETTIEQTFLLFKNFGVRAPEKVLQIERDDDAKEDIL